MTKSQNTLERVLITTKEQNALMQNDLKSEILDLKASQFSQKDINQNLQVNQFKLEKANEKLEGINEWKLLSLSSAKEKVDKRNRYLEISNQTISSKNIKLREQVDHFDANIRTLKAGFFSV